MILGQRILTRLKNTGAQGALGNDLICTWLNNARSNTETPDARNLIPNSPYCDTLSGIGTSPE